MLAVVITLSALLAISQAGYISPLPYHGYHAPVIAAPVIKAAVPVATSYASTVHISHGAVPIPVVKAAPVIVKTPVIAPAVIKAPLYSPYAFGHHY